MHFALISGPASSYMVDISQLFDLNWKIVHTCPRMPSRHHLGRKRRRAAADVKRDKAARTRRKKKAKRAIKAAKKAA